MMSQSKRNKAGRPAASRQISSAADEHGSTPAEPAVHAAHSDRAAWRVAFKLAALFMVLGAIGLVPLMLWRSPTRIVADLLVKRLVFATGHDTAQVPITEQPTGFEALTLEKFSKVSLA